MQKGMLFEYLSAPESGMYVRQLMITLRGPLDVKAFQKSWQQVVDRQPVLRKFFTWDRDEEPLQEVRLNVASPFELQDWSGILEDRRQERLRTLLAADRARGFTLSEASLLRVLLLRIAPDVYQALITFHHLILDGWSLPLLFKEVFAFYEEQVGERPYVPPRVAPYSDYIHWLEKQDLSGAEAYWREALRDFRAPTAIASRSTGRDSGGDIFAEQQIQFTPEEDARLQSAAKRHGLTLSILVQAAWALLLSRYSGEQDVVFGLTLSGRSANVPDIETMIGLFINTLPVRARVKPRQTLLSWTKNLQARQIELSQYEHTPLPQARKWSEMPAGTPLFESIVVFENYPLDASLLKPGNGLVIEDVRAVEVTNYPLTVTAVPHSDLRLMISYDRRRFEDAGITRMLHHLETILLSMEAAWRQPIQDVAWITPAERSQLLVEWNPAPARQAPVECAHRLFEDQAKRTPEEIAVTFGPQQMTYAELDRRANRLANYLNKMGVTPERYVGFCAERSLEMVIGILGILKAGGVYAPIDSSWPAQRKALVLAETQALLLLTSRRLLAALPAFDGQVVCMDSEWEQTGEPVRTPAAQAESR